MCLRGRAWFMSYFGLHDPYLPGWLGQVPRMPPGKMIPDPCLLGLGLSEKVAYLPSHGMVLAP